MEYNDCNDTDSLYTEIRKKEKEIRKQELKKALLYFGGTLFLGVWACYTVYLYFRVYP